MEGRGDVQKGEVIGTPSLSPLMMTSESGATHWMRPPNLEGGEDGRRFRI
jgi:hypothetical protein